MSASRLSLPLLARTSLARVSAALLCPLLLAASPALADDTELSDETGFEVASLLTDSDLSGLRGGALMIMGNNGPILYDFSYFASLTRSNAAQGINETQFTFHGNPALMTAQLRQQVADLTKAANSLKTASTTVSDSAFVPSGAPQLPPVDPSLAGNTPNLNTGSAAVAESAGFAPPMPEGIVIPAADALQAQEIVTQVNNALVLTNSVSNTNIAAQQDLTVLANGALASALTAQLLSQLDQTRITALR